MSSPFLGGVGVLLKYMGRVIKSIAAVIAGAFVVPVALLHGGLYNRLPAWAQPWDNDREPFGDTMRYAELIDARIAGSKLKQFWLRYKWLGFRNPANNLGRTLGERKWVDAVFIHSGNPNTSDQGESGWRLTKAYYGNTGVLYAFEFYLVWAYGSARCLRVRLGWKLWDDPAPLVHVINPVMTFTGKR